MPPLFDAVMLLQRCVPLSLFLSLVMLAVPAAADTFGEGENAFEIPFVKIGDPGAPADTTGVPNPAGGVGYTYWMGKYEIPEEAIRKANAQSELGGEPLGITLDERGPDKPATGVSWFEAALFVNWLNEDRGHAPAYKFDSSGEFQLWELSDPGYSANNPLRNSQAIYVLPSIDEWYKAAFYDPVADVWWDYPTGSDTPPIPVASGSDPGTAVWNQLIGPADVSLAGGESPFGTVGQGGNAIEWQEGPINGVLDAVLSLNVRAYRNGRWGLATSSIGISNMTIAESVASRSAVELGLRVAKIPEPCGYAMTWLCVALLHSASTPRAR